MVSPTRAALLVPCRGGWGVLLKCSCSGGGGGGRDVGEAKFLARKNTNNPKHKLEREFGFNCYFYFFNKKDSLEKQSFNS